MCAKEFIKLKDCYLVSSWFSSPHSARRDADADSDLGSVSSSFISYWLFVLHLVNSSFYHRDMRRSRDTRRTSSTIHLPCVACVKGTHTDKI
jgi:hypothetical protein